jgi:uncharacterized damage-inducible protein DinB
MTSQINSSIDTERADLLEALAKHRYFLRHTVQGLSEDQARLSPTASELTLGGLIKHVANTEKGWADFIVNGSVDDEIDYDGFAEGFRMGPEETLDGLLATYAEIAAATDALVISLPDLNSSHALPEAPWNPPGARMSARRALIHIIAETSQHAGHADILRESIDGQKTMG